MGSRSRRKGKSGEREAAKELSRVLGIDARRGQQFRGGPDSPDVVSSLPGLHIEVKRTEAFRLYAALEQASSDTGPGQVPLVLHRKNRHPWVLVLRLDDLPQLIKEISQYDATKCSE
jgi:Holliday junction resolvase